MRKRAVGIQEKIRRLQATIVFRVLSALTPSLNRVETSLTRHLSLLKGRGDPILLAGEAPALQSDKRPRRNRSVARDAVAASLCEACLVVLVALAKHRYSTQ